MDHDEHGNPVDGPTGHALSTYFDGVARNASPSELAGLADEASAHCCRCRNFYTAESQASPRVRLARVLPS